LKYASSYERHVANRQKLYDRKKAEAASKSPLPPAAPRANVSLVKPAPEIPMPLVRVPLQNGELSRPHPLKITAHEIRDEPPKKKSHGIGSTISSVIFSRLFRGGKK
jgi:hypothetical protein